MLAPAPNPVIAPAIGTATDIGGLAAFGKVAFVLLFVIAFIFLCSWLIRQLGQGRGSASQRLQLIAAKSLGSKEKIVIVEIEGTWLVLGVAAGGISKLHELPAVKTATSPVRASTGDSFARRFASALKHNLRGGAR